MNAENRELDVADAALAGRLLSIQHRAYQVEADLIGFQGIPPLAEDLAALMATQDRWLGRFAGGELVAALAFELSDDSLHINRLIVDPDHFHRGHARALIAYLEAGHARQTWGVSTSAANHPAIGLYRSFGFEQTGTSSPAPGLELAHFVRSAQK